jgi:hypothetical protein
MEKNAAPKVAFLKKPMLNMGYLVVQIHWDASLSYLG